MQIHAKTRFKKYSPLNLLLIICCLLIIIDFFWIYIKLPIASKKYCFSTTSLPVTNRPIIILGAGVLPNRRPSQLLKARLKVGLKLFHEGKGKWFLVSGDNRAANYNEPQAMRKWLLNHGVPANLIVSDVAGQRTYDSLKRAKVVFGINKVIIVTSDSHLIRAIFLAKNMGLDAYGVVASTKITPLYKKIHFFIREYIASNRAIWDTWFPPPITLGSRENTPDD